MSGLSIPGDTMFERIEKYYTEDGFKLDAKEEEICQRWESAFALLLKHKIRSVAIKKHAKVNNVTERTSWSDLKNAERLFTPMQKYRKEFVRMVVIESAMRDVKACEKRIKDNPEMKTNEWNLIMSAKDKAEKRIIKAAGLDMYDPNLPDFSKIQPNVYQIKLPDEVKNMFKRVIGTGVVDITHMMNSVAEPAKIIEDK